MEGEVLWWVRRSLCGLHGGFELGRWEDGVGNIKGVWRVGSCGRGVEVDSSLALKAGVVREGRGGG